ncbi:peroxiredoxin family protein [Bacillus pinisoli]
MLLTEIKNVTLTDLNGDQVSVSDYKGKNTLIFMWASW